MGGASPWDRPLTTMCRTQAHFQQHTSSSELWMRCCLISSSFLSSPSCLSHVPPNVGYLYCVLISFFMFFLCSDHFADFPVSWDWPDLRSSSKLPRHFAEAIKNFFDSLMSHQTLAARHIQFLFPTWTGPVSFSPARRASELPLRSGLARGLSRDPS